MTSRRRHAEAMDQKAICSGDSGSHQNCRKDSTVKRKIKI